MENGIAYYSRELGIGNWKRVAALCAQRKGIEEQPKPDSGLKRHELIRTMY